MPYKNKEFKRLYDAKWREENRERMRNKDAEWHKKNKKRHGETNRRRRLRQNNAEGSHTFDEWEVLKKKFDYRCLCCKKKEPDIKLTRDHIVPLTKGGSDFIGNIQPLCRPCNGRKGNRVIVDYRI